MKKLMMMIAACAMMMVACDNDEEEKDSSPYYFGYFEGEVDGQFYSISNSRYDTPIGSAIWINHGDLQTIQWGTKLQASNDTNVYRLSVYLRSPHRGIYVIEKSIVEAQLSGGIASGVILDKENTTGEQISRYVPDPERNKFYFNILKYWYTDKQYSAFAEGEINGVLYNEKNPQDSIVIQNAKFGLH